MQQQTLGYLPIFKITLACIQTLLCYRQTDSHTRSITAQNPQPIKQVTIGRSPNSSLEGSFHRVLSEPKGKKNEIEKTTVNSES